MKYKMGDYVSITINNICYPGIITCVRPDNTFLYKIDTKWNKMGLEVFAENEIELICYASPRGLRMKVV